MAHLLGKPRPLFYAGRPAAAHGKESHPVQGPPGARMTGCTGDEVNHLNSNAFPGGLREQLPSRAPAWPAFPLAVAGWSVASDDDRPDDVLTPARRSACR